MYHLTIELKNMTVSDRKMLEAMGADLCADGTFSVKRNDLEVVEKFDYTITDWAGAQGRLDDLTTRVIGHIPNHEVNAVRALYGK